MIKIDVAALLPEIKAQLKRELQKRITQQLDEVLDPLFATPENYQSFRRKGYKGSDLGEGYNYVAKAVDKVSLKLFYESYVDEYVEAHFKKALDKALAEAVERKARKLAAKELDSERFDKL